MNRNISCFITLALILIAPLVFANSVPAEDASLLASDSASIKALNPSNQEKANSFFRSTLEKLPTSLLNEINGRVQISFSNFNGAALKTPLCGNFSDGQVRDQFEMMPSPFVDAQRVEISSSSDSKQKYMIKLNSNFIGVILQSEEKAATYNCGHRNLYRYTQAVLVRELARLYDDLNIFPRSNANERALLMQCAFANGPVPIRQVDDRCRQLQEWKRSVSDRPIWRSLRHLQNQSNSQNLASDFVRHMEFYALDPEFPCRKPAVHAFLNHYFSVTTPVQCALNTTIPVNMAHEQINLDIHRLYQIHILVADPGPKIESQWGHIMFRLVMCSPKRATIGPECLQDVDSHIVVGFLGAPGTILTSNWDGIRGKYPSVLSIQPFATALNEYTIKESRSLTSVPLKLSENEKILFVYRSLEDFWAYQGKYLFFTNNCATEARNFLQGILQQRNYNLLRRQGLIETPTMFFNFLAEQGYADVSVLKNKDEIGSYILNSPRNKWSKDAGQDLMTELESLSAEGRRQLYETKKLVNPKHLHETAITFYEAELEIYAHLKSAKDQVLQSFVNEDQKNLRGDYIPLVNQLQNEVTILSPKNLVVPGYGIPLNYEFKSQNQIDKTHEEIKKIIQQLETLLRRDRPEIYEALTESNDNMKYFYIDIRTTKPNN